MGPFFSWPSDHANEDVVAGVGFWLTLVGFVITWVQLWRTRSAAVAAKREAARIEKSLHRYEAVNEAARASTALSTARTFVRSGLWANVPDSYETVRAGLQALKSDAVRLTDDQRTAIDSACAYIQSTCAKIERHLQGGPNTLNIAKTISVMGEQKMLLTEITKRIEKEAIS